MKAIALVFVAIIVALWALSNVGNPVADFFVKLGAIVGVISGGIIAKTHLDDQL